jgi:periplasmic protein TonB
MAALTFPRCANLESNFAVNYATTDTTARQRMRCVSQAMQCDAVCREYALVMMSDLPGSATPAIPGVAAAGVAMPVNAMGSWRYHTGGGRRWQLVTALVVSFAVHFGLLFGFGRTKPPPRKHVRDDTPTISITMPNLKDLDEPEPAPNDDPAPVEVATLVPMQADVPQIPSPSDFVQAMDFSSLLEKPDVTNVKVFTIPEHRTGANIRQNIGAIFNLADLDRRPEPIVQAAPVFPATLKREVDSATVRVEFIVDTGGQVVNATVVETTHEGFNSAAIAGVSRWKFRAGIRSGKRVNTRMSVPILFKLTEQID